MNSEEQVDRVLESWLAVGPTNLSDRSVAAIVDQLDDVKQRRLFWLPGLRRGFPVNWFVPALGSAVVVVMAALALNFYVNRPSIGGPVFQGTWVSTSDADGGTQTMTIGATGDGAVEIVVTDDVASVCSGGPSTMTGTGKLAGSTVLVIPSPTFTCDDGSEPEALSGPPLQEQLRNLTFVLEPEAETLTDNFGGLWLREGAEVPSPRPTISGGMWPQTNLEQVRQAQKRADAGDPDYTWQARALVEPEAWTEHIELELVDRFIREVLGWEAYLFNGYASGNVTSFDFDTSFDAEGRPVGTLLDHRYVRCAPGRTNPLYPPQPDSEQPGESCAPTIDDLNYESVSLDLAQLDRQGSGGIWVVTRWQMTAPFAQVDPAVVEAQATERLEEFLAARIAGNGAEGYVPFVDDVPLLYATMAGAPYERYEIERMEVWWPTALMSFSARLFADGDATVVEQAITWLPGEGLSLDFLSTTENDQPVVLSYTSSDGEVTVSAPSPWAMLWHGGEVAAEAAPDVWFGLLSRDYSNPESHEVIGLVDPVAYDAWCAANGGSPLLSAPADAAAIARQVIADPNLETTAPVAARVGGLEAVSIDVALAPGGRGCGIGMIEISRWIHELWDPGLRLRLYLVDLPEGMSVPTLAITVVAPEERFEELIEEATPIIDSIEFHPG